ncbi:MAG: hypothetical protein ABH950_00065 [Candidatus Altiarchaeota archaeon]
MDDTRAKKAKFGFLFFLAIGLLFVLLNAVAAEEDESGTGFFQPILDGLSNIFRGFFVWLIKIVTVTMKWNPRTYPLYHEDPPGTPCNYQEDCALPAISNIIKMMLVVLMPIYQVFILYYGIMIIWGSKNPRQRVQFKDRLQRFLTGMVFVSLSPILFQVFIDMETTIVKNIMDIAETYIAGDGIYNFLEGFLPGMMILITIIVIICFLPVGIPIPFIVTILLTPVLLLVFRYLMVMIFGAIFPLTMFFYTFEFTKGLGQKLFRSSVIWIFMPIIQAVFIALFFLSADATNAVMSLAWLCLLLFMLAFYPMQITGMLGHVGGAISATGETMSSTKRVFLGNMMRGAGFSGALMAAGQYAGMGRGHHTPSSGMHEKPNRPSSGGSGPKLSGYFRRGGASGEGGFRAIAHEIITKERSFRSDSYKMLYDTAKTRLGDRDINDVKKRKDMFRTILGEDDAVSKKIRKQYENDKKNYLVSPDEKRFFELRMAKGFGEKVWSVGRSMGHNLLASWTVPIGRVLFDLNKSVYGEHMPGSKTMGHIGGALGGKYDGDKWSYGSMGRLAKETFNKWKASPVKFGLKAGVGLSLVGSLFTPIFLPAAIGIGLGASLGGKMLVSAIGGRRRSTPDSPHRPINQEKQNQTQSKVDDYQKTGKGDFFSSNEYDEDQKKAGGERQFYGKDEFAANKSEAQVSEHYRKSDMGEKFKGQMTGANRVVRDAESGKADVARLAIDFDRVGLKNELPGVTITGSRKKEYDRKLADAYREDLIRGNEKAEPDKKLLDKEVDKKVGEFSEALEKNESLNLFNKSRTGVGYGTLRTHELAHRELDKIGNDRLRGIWDSVPENERSKIMGEVFNDWNHDDYLGLKSKQRPDVAMNEYFAEGLTNMGKHRRPGGFELDPNTQKKLLGELGPGGAAALGIREAPSPKEEKKPSPDRKETKSDEKPKPTPSKEKKPEAAPGEVPAPQKFDETDRLRPGDPEKMRATRQKIEEHNLRKSNFFSSDEYEQNKDKYYSQLDYEQNKFISTRSGRMLNRDTLTDRQLRDIEAEKAKPYTEGLSKRESEAAVRWKKMDDDQWGSHPGRYKELEEKWSTRSGEMTAEESQELNEFKKGEFGRGTPEEIRHAELEFKQANRGIDMTAEEKVDLAEHRRKGTASNEFIQEHSRHIAAAERAQRKTQGETLETTLQDEEKTEAEKTKPKEDKPSPANGWDQDRESRIDSPGTISGGSKNESGSAVEKPQAEERGQPSEPGPQMPPRKPSYGLFKQMGQDLNKGVDEETKKLNEQAAEDSKAAQREERSYEGLDQVQEEKAATTEREMRKEQANLDKKQGKKQKAVDSEKKKDKPKKKT